MLLLADDAAAELIRAKEILRKTRPDEVNVHSIEEAELTFIP